MEETFYKRVNYPENKPEQNGQYVVWYKDGKNIVNSVYDWDGESWGWKGHVINTMVTHFLKPLPILSRGKMIEVILEEMFMLEDDMPNKKKAEYIADAILKSGLPEKKVEIKRGKYGNDFVICPSCKDEEHLIGMDNNFCPNCGSKITWIS